MSNTRNGNANKTCANPLCAQGFAPKRSTGKFCSTACRVAAFRLAPEQVKKRRLEKTRRWIRRAAVTYQGIKIDKEHPLSGIPLPSQDVAENILRAQNNPNALTLNMLDYKLEVQKGEEQ